SQAQGSAGAGPGRSSSGPRKTEEDPPDWRPIRSAMRGPAAIRHVEEAVPAGAPEGIALRYGSFYGPGASDFLLDMLRKRQGPVIGGGGGGWAFIGSTHAAAAAPAAVGRGAPRPFHLAEAGPT